MLFPRHESLSERWFEAIQVGCGILMELADGRDLSQTEICLSHFGKADNDDGDEVENRYQEPKLFINGYVCTVVIGLHGANCYVSAMVIQWK